MRKMYDISKQLINLNKQYDYTKMGGVSLLRSPGVNLLRSTGVTFGRSSGVCFTEFYNKAKYAPETGWTFDQGKLGDKNNRRIIDKFKWVRQITGKPFDIEKEFSHFNNLRKLRNHLNHFDPPTLVVSIEEATQWLNDVLYVGQILIKMRQAINAPFSLLIIELICQKLAKFNPEPAFSNRLPIKGYGYQTSMWPECNEEE